MEKTIIITNLFENIEINLVLMEIKRFKIQLYSHISRAHAKF